MKLLVILLFSFAATCCFCEETKAKQSFGNSENFLSETFKSLDKSNSELFGSSLLSIETKVTEYFKEKRQMCSGIFKFTEVDEEGNEKKLSKKLTRDEKKLCLYEIKKNQIFYINQLIKSKKTYYRLRHKENISGLNSLKEEMLKDLERSFQKTKSRRRIKKR
jgi:hypothetical protein